MGRYATTTSISVLMPHFLAGNTTTGDTYGAAVFSKAADRAEAEVNAAITARYDPSTWTTTGTPALPPLVVKLAEDLACLYSMRSVMVQDSQIKNPNLAEWAKAQDTLDLLREGKVKLTYTDGSTVPTKADGRMGTSTDYPHITNLDDENAWGVASTRLDDIASERDV
jgi:hypothetical protein